MRDKYSIRIGDLCADSSKPETVTVNYHNTLNQVQYRRYTVASGAAYCAGGFYLAEGAQA